MGLLVLIGGSLIGTVFTIANTIGEEVNAHLQHSATYTQKIDDAIASQEKLETRFERYVVDSSAVHERNRALTDKVDQMHPPPNVKEGIKENAQKIASIELRVVKLESTK